MRDTVRAVAAVAILAVSLAACSRPLPEADSAQAKLYVLRCGGCHAPFQPHTLAPAMWKLQVDRMDQKFHAAGIPAPSSAEREQILDYLTRNAGG